MAMIALLLVLAAAVLRWASWLEEDRQVTRLEALRSLVKSEDA